MIRCRGCGLDLNLSFIDLGKSPVANNLVSIEDRHGPEVFLPLHVRVCESCALVQLPELSSRESLFAPDYVYYSSFSTSWLRHSETFAQRMYSELKLEPSDFVVEIASNDGYLLQYFMQLGVKTLGVEPAAGVAEVANQKGIPTIVDFFGIKVAQQLAAIEKPRLMIANNVLAHVPDLNDFIGGFATLMSDEGLATFEFPHLLNLIKRSQFDTIYHEHFSYLSITALEPLFETHGLRIVNVEELSTHGGSLRLFVARSDSNWSVSSKIQEIRDEELKFDPRSNFVREELHQRVLKIKWDLMSELIRLKSSGCKIAAYGAAAKGNTLLNYIGVDSDLIEYVVDLNPQKQNKFLPGSGIPIVGVEYLNNRPPDVLLVLPWNLSQEIKSQVAKMDIPDLRFLRVASKVEYF